MTTIAQIQIDKAQKLAKRESLSRKFLLAWKAHGGPDLTPEWRFHETRKWRFDFVWLAIDDRRHDFTYFSNRAIAIELEGGTWVAGRHSRGQGIEDDCIKYNAATLAGWKVFRLTTNMITREHLELIIKLCV